MIPHPSRPIQRLFSMFSLLLVFLVLALGCSKSAHNSTPAAAPEQSPQLQERVVELSRRAARLNSQLAGLREAQAQQLAALTSESQSLIAELNILNLQLEGKPLPPAVRPQPSARGPLTPLVRFFLIIIMLFALWIIARIFLGRLGEEDEEEDDLAAEPGDEDLSSDEGTIPMNSEPPSQPGENKP